MIGAIITGGLGYSPSLLVTFGLGVGAAGVVLPEYQPAEHMPTTTANSILTKVRYLLQEPTADRWTDSELIGWLNDGQREIAMLRPDSCSLSARTQLSAGVRQLIPAGGISIVKVLRNMGDDGLTPGPAIRKVPVELLDAQSPDWTAAARTTTIQHYMIDERNPRSYYVYPPADGTTYVDLLYAAAPADVATGTDTITVEDIYSNALIDYICCRAYMKDQDLAGNAERAAMHRTNFTAVMGGKSQADSVITATKNNLKG